MYLTRERLVEQIEEPFARLGVVKEGAGGGPAHAAHAFVVLAWRQLGQQRRLARQGRALPAGAPGARVPALLPIRHERRQQRQESEEHDADDQSEQCGRVADYQCELCAHRRAPGTTRYRAWAVRIVRVLLWEGWVASPGHYESPGPSAHRGADHELLQNFSSAKLCRLLASVCAPSKGGTHARLDDGGRAAEVPLADGLELLLLARDVEPARCDRAVPRWHARLRSEQRLSGGQAQLALAALNALPGPGVESAVHSLVALCEAHGLGREVQVLEAWLAARDT